MYTAYLDGSLKLDAEGRWLHNGIFFQNNHLSVLFHKSIIWDPVANRYFVQIGEQRASFELEDCAYFVRELLTEKSPWLLRLSDGTSEPINPYSLKTGIQAQIYTLVHSNHRARFSRPAHQELMRYVVDEETINIDGQLICLKST